MFLTGQEQVLLLYYVRGGQAPALRVRNVFDRASRPGGLAYPALCYKNVFRLS